MISPPTPREKDPRYLVGIDLGTTHTVVAYADSEEGGGEIHLFEIEQLVAPGEVKARPLLPSVRYHPALGEVAEGDLLLPWSEAGEGGEPPPVMGELARSLGAKTRGRTVASAKSWLSHPSVDRTAPILPWGAAEDAGKVSPVRASAGYLAHVRAAWNARFPGHPLEKQEVVVTVPASFDEAARALTVAAAEEAGIGKLRLLEEPQAVVYDWLRRHRRDLKEALAGVRLLLVCDVGGGTTDLTLIKVEIKDSEPKLTRIGVGDHLMLGGDNIDLTLAHLAERRIAGDGERLGPADLSQLIEQCRLAKERLLEENGPERIKVTLLGAGAKLVGGARSAEVGREEVREIALEGFFPLSGYHDLPDRKRSGVVEFGLPYTPEPAVSKHIAAFLHHHRQVCCDALGEETGAPVPDAILLNGGVFKSPAISRRVREVIGGWRGEPPRQLENRHPELAVAYGAVAYALARRGKQPGIGGGSARSYFLLTESEQAEKPLGVCILPRGSEEGAEIVLESRSFALRLGEPVRFHLASSTGDTPYRPGDLAEIGEEGFIFLPPLAVAFDASSRRSASKVRVKLAASLTEVGTLKIECLSTEEKSQRWNVEFQLRKNRPEDRLVSIAQIHPRLTEAAGPIQLVFGPKSKVLTPKAAKTLRADLEKILGDRSEWATPLLRELFGLLLEGMKYRRRSAVHERVWLSLTGFCLRPGFGYALDDWRVEQIWRGYDQGLQFVNETQNWTEWWTLWRRIAGGLDAAAQERIFADIAKFIDPVTARQGKNWALLRQRGYDDMVRLAGALERLKVARKAELGEWLLQRLTQPGEPNQSWWAVGRIGARVPFHGGAHQVIPPETAAAWLERILGCDWKKAPQAAFAAVLIARMSGDRARDIDSDLRNKILGVLQRSKAPASWVEMVAEVKDLDEADEKRIYGESLPPGLKLIG